MLEASEDAKPASTGILRRFYDWVLAWAETRYALAALVVISFAESSFFPIPPDVLLIAMAMAAPSRAFGYAAWCSVASVAGGVLGYVIGVGLMDVVGCRLIDVYHGQSTFDWLALRFEQYNFWAVFVAAVTPIPYKIFTIAAGAVGADFWTFLFASALGRPARFFAVAAAIYYFGPPVKRLIDKYFELLSIAFVVLLIGGFAAIRLVGGERAVPTAETHPGSAYVRLCAGG